VNESKKTVVITGGTKGIGAAIAKKFYDNDMNVFVGSRNDSGLANELGKGVYFVKMDVRRESGHIRLAERALKQTGRLDIYVNCAGFSKWMPIVDVTDSFWDEMIDTNLKGTFWGCKIAARYLKRGGCIINISSLAGKRGSANNSVYCASKFGIVGLTQALAKELGHDGIRVNAVCPVYVETKGVIAALKEKVSPAAGMDVMKYLKKFAKSQSALQRLPLAEEVAEVCLFLSSEKASAITGQSINVDCGVLPQ